MVSLPFLINALIIKYILNRSFFCSLKHTLLYFRITSLYFQHLLLYPNTMTMVRAKSRLTRLDWTLAAFELLVKEGVAAVSVDRLAKHLRVTRGSFYHHFSDRDELLNEVLQYWSESLTTRVRDQVINLDLDPGTTLLVLLKTIRSERAAEYDAPFRAWALHDERAAAILREVDKVRLQTIRQLFEALGFKGIELENRARLFLYYEIAAPAMFLDGSDSDQRLIERHRFLITPAGEKTTDD